MAGGWAKPLRLLCVWCAVVAIAGPAAAQEKATIAVLPFDVATGASEYEIQTSLLTDAVVRALVASRKFAVVDRARLERVRREQRFGGSGLVDAASRARAGKLLGADYLVLGTIRDFSVDPPRAMAYGSGWTRPVRITAEVQVIDASSGQIVAAQSATGAGQARATGSADSAGVARQGLESAATALADDALASILNAAFPIKVLEVSGDVVRLNRGADAGVESGTVLRCFTTGAVLRDPDTKEVLGTSETPAGSVTIVEVLPKLSVAQLVSDSGLARGNVCRVDEDGAAATGARRAPAPPGDIYSY